MKRRYLISLAATLLLPRPLAAETLELPGLSAPATVQTDELGVPHVTAVTLEDAFRVQGWVAARDRFLQMDRERRSANGTLAELTGSITDLQQDALAKLANIPGAARRSAELMTPEVLRLYQAYADGVNAWLAAHKLPAEYSDLEVSRVPTWTVLDSVAQVKGRQTNGQNRLFEKLTDTEALADYVAAGPACGADGRALFEEDAARIAPMLPVATLPDASAPGIQATASQRDGSSPTGVPSPRAAERAGANLARRLLRRLEALPGLAPLRRDPGGSNAWGVAGAKTGDGNPLVACDPHQEAYMPSLQYELHLVVTDDPAHGALNLSGGNWASGQPGISLPGQNQHLVWGATAFYPDAFDVFADRLVRGDPTCPSRLCIDSAGALHPVEESAATYRLNLLGDGIADNTSDVTSAVAALLPQAVRILRVPFRSFGPVYEIDDPAVVDDGEKTAAETQVLTVQYVGLHGTRDPEAALDLQLATNVGEFLAAVRRHSQSNWHFVVADRAGALAYAATGEIPLRADLEAGFVHDDGPRYVRDGSGPSNWLPDPARSQGQEIPFQVIPREDMPEVVNPPSGFVVTANNDPVEDTLDNDLYDQPRPSSPGTIRYIGFSSIPGLRAARITALLREKVEASEPLTLDDMRRIQTDGAAHDATLLVPVLLAAWANAQGAGAPPALAAFVADPEIAEAMGRLAAWDFTAPTGIPEGWDASSYTSDADGVRSETVPPEEVAASVANTIYQVWRAELVGDVVLTALDRCGLDPSYYARSLQALYELLSADPFSGVGASGLDFFPEPAALSAAGRRDVALLQALEDTLELLASNTFAAAFGSSTNQDDYRWGRLHRIVFAHPLGGDRNLPPAAGFEDLGPGLPGLSRDGAWEAINRTGRAVDSLAQSPAEFGEATYISSSRWIAEPVPVEGPEEGLRALSSLAGGASEHVESPLYANRMARWLTGDHDDVLVTPAQIASLPSEPAAAAAVSKKQRSCVQTANAAGAKVGKAQGKQDTACLTAAAKGKEADPEACLTADANGKVAKARGDAAAKEGKKCVAGEIPTFGYAGAFGASDAAAAASLGLVEDLFGPSLTGAVITRAADKAGAACQAELLKSSQAALEAIWKEAAKVKKAALEGKKGAAPIESGIELEDALIAIFAPSEKVEKALAKVAKAAEKKCGSVADLAAAFPGRCKVTGATADSTGLGLCAREGVLCRGCRSVGAMDALALPCDRLDDAEIDDSCG